MSKNVFLFSLELINWYVISCSPINPKHEDEATSPIEITDPIKKYLHDHSKSIMAIGEGKIYKNFDSSVFTVDVSKDVLPDLVADINDLKAMAAFPSSSFDIIKLVHLPTQTFDQKPHATFSNLARILKPNGVLEFNDMWGGFSVEAEHQKLYDAQKNDADRQYILMINPKSVVPLLKQKGQLLNPFNQYLTADEFNGMVGKKVPENKKPGLITQSSYFRSSF